MSKGFGIGNYEDDELGNRMLAEGHDLRVADEAVVIHHGSATFEALGLDYAAVVHEASQHLTEGATPNTGLTMALVLSDGDSVGAAASAATDSASQICVSRSEIRRGVMRFRLNCRQRDNTVTGSFCGSVVASRNLTCGGGSSSVFNNALKELLESMCTSSIR